MPKRRSRDYYYNWEVIGPDGTRVCVAGYNSVTVDPGVSIHEVCNNIWQGLNKSFGHAGKVIITEFEPV